MGTVKHAAALLCASALFASAVSLAGCSDELVLAEGGRTDYTLVHPDNLSTGETFVVEDVAGLLSRAIGSRIAVTNLSAAPKEKCIFYSIAPAGFDADSLEDQEHCICTDGKNVHLFGGGPNGARYAAYSFLQKDLGFRFFDTHGGVKVPEGALRLQPMQARRKFSFRFRFLNGGGSMFNRPESSIFLYRHGQNNWVGRDLDQSGFPVPPDDCRMAWPSSHSLRTLLPADDKESTLKWIKALKLPNLKDEHPDYFSMDAKGKRVFNHQYCLSNAGCRELLKERFLEHIRRNPDCNVFDLSAGDTEGLFCHCAGCKALVEKYGTVAGPLVDFIIELCPEVKAKFPGVLITSLAYRKKQTQPPPVRGVERLPDNFMPDFAPINDNFAKDWFDPSNAKTYEDLKGWCRLCRNVMVWYYPNPYNEILTPPLGNVERAVNDLLLMEKAGVTAHFWEHNVGVAWNVGFTELQSYVFARMMNDTSLDWRQLADEFIEFEYGAAGPAFRKYWLELERLRKDEALSLNWNAAASTYLHLTPDRLVRWNADFDRMEETVRDDPARLCAIQRVRANLDYAILIKYPEVKKAGLTLSADFIADRILKVVRRVTDDFCQRRFYKIRDRFIKAIDEKVEFLRYASTETKPLPTEIFGSFDQEKVFSFLPTVKGSKHENDPAAAYGIRAVFAKYGEKGITRPLGALLEDRVANKVKNLAMLDAKNVPPRGEYKFFKLGKCQLTMDCLLRFGGTWISDIRVDVSRAWEVGSYNDATFWISLKFEGPAFYPEDEGKPNRVYCDRVVVVRD